MIDLTLIFLLLLIGWFWSSSMAARERALHAVARYCQKMQLQLLDDCVALNGFWIKRDGKGRLQPWRAYLFEFSSTGAERYQGKIVFLGHQIESIYLDPYRENDEHIEH